MGKSTVHEVIQRAISDAAFRRQLQANPKKALGGFSLSPEETAAITSGDPARLTALGVDQRMSKAFALGAFGDASKGIIGDPTTGAAARSIDTNIAGSSGSQALVSPGVDDASPLVSSTGDYISDGLGGGVVRADLTGGAKPSAAVTAEFDAQSGTGTISIDEGSISGSSAAVTGAESAGQRHLRMVEQDLASGTAAVVGGTAESAAERHLRMVEQDLNASSSATAFEPAGAPGTMSVDEGSISGSEWRAAPIEGSPEASESAATSEGESAGQSHLRRLEQDLDTGEATSGGTADPTEY